MTIIKCYDKTFRICKTKADPSIKVVFEIMEYSYSEIYRGTMEQVKAWIKHQKSLAYQREKRHIIADMCGTSYAAAIKDMGGIR